MKSHTLPGIERDAIDGLLGYNVFRVDNINENGDVQFMTILWWKDIQSIKAWFNNSKEQEAFTNNDFRAAHIPDDSKEVLYKWDKFCTHYKIIAQKSISKL